MSRNLLGLALRLTVVVTSAIVISALLAGSAHASPDGGRLTVVLVHGAWADNSSWDGHCYGGSVITNAAEGNGEVDGGSHLTLVSHPEAVTAVIQQAIDSVQQP